MSVMGAVTHQLCPITFNYELLKAFTLALQRPHANIRAIFLSSLWCRLFVRQGHFFTSFQTLLVNV